MEGGLARLHVNIAPFLQIQQWRAQNKPIQAFKKLIYQHYIAGRRRAFEEANNAQDTTTHALPKLPVANKSFIQWIRGCLENSLANNNAKKTCHSCFPSETGMGCSEHLSTMSSALLHEQCVRRKLVAFLPHGLPQVSVKMLTGLSSEKLRITVILVPQLQTKDVLRERIT